MATSDEDVPEQPVPECNSLKVAVDSGDKQCIRNILRSKFNVPQDEKHDKMPLLHLIIKFGNYEIDEMIEKDPDLKVKGMECLKLLLESTIYKTDDAIDVDEDPVIYQEEFGPIRGLKSGFSPLHRAAYQGNGAYVTQLLERYLKWCKRIDILEKCYIFKI